MSVEDTGGVTVGYVVVVNDEGQYSVWPVGRALAPGWRPAGFTGTREECLAHIEAVWTDMRPQSQRERSAGSAAS